MRINSWLRATLVPVALACGTSFDPAAAAAADSIVPAFNLFTVEQDIAIGRESAAEAEQKLPLLKDPSTDAYLTRIVERLAVEAPGAKYPYRIQAVNDPAINAFALPGGPMYANRGLLVAARSEAELAGVIAHEMAHVALRHGTHQASKAYLANAGLEILGGLLGDSAGDSTQMLATVGGLGLNAAFLKFGRDDEYEADQVGAEIMTSAGYDPAAMADFFALLRETGARDPSALETFFSDHPPSAEREARIRSYAKSAARTRSREVGGFANTVARLQHLPTAKSQTRTASTSKLQPSRPPSVSARPPSSVRVAAPSARFETFEHRKGYFAIEHPANWKVYAAKSEFATSIAPAGGIVERPNGQPALVYGVVINHYAPFEGESRRRTSRKRISLEDASDDLVKQILRSNPYLSAPKRAAKRDHADGASARSVTLSGRSPVTGENERVVVLMRGLDDEHVVYGLLVVPGRDYETALPIFKRMMQTLNMNDRAKHS